MKRFSQLLENDKELTDLKEQYEKKFGKPAFGYNYDEFPTIEDYKNRLRKRIEEKKK